MNLSLYRRVLTRNIFWEGRRVFGQKKYPTTAIWNIWHWPRAMAISEVLWSPKSTHNWDDFAHRVEEKFKYLDADSVKYSRSMYDPIITAINGKDDSMKIEVTSEMPS